jgi:uncharacterized membrane protein YdbT with pleckstrin-like domain
MANKMKAGELRVEVEQENKLWYDRKRVTIFALPLSFTKYTLTETKLTVEKGFLNTNEEEVKLYRITDVSYSQTLLERIGGTGTIKILSNDSSSPELLLQHVKNAKIVKEAISKAVDDARRNNNVKTSEMVGNVDLDGDECCDCENHTC